MNINNLIFRPDYLEESADLLEDTQLFRAEEETFSPSSLLSSHGPLRKRKISDEFPNFSLDSVPRPSTPFRPHQEDLKGRKITLEKSPVFPPIANDLGRVQQESRFSSSIQGKAVPPPFTIYLPPTNDSALNKILNGMTVSQALDCVDRLIKLISDTPTAAPVNPSSASLSGPSGFLIPEEEPDPFQEPTVFHELTPNSTRKHDGDDGKSPILEGSLLFQDILEEAAHCGNMARVYRNYEGRLPFKLSAFEKRVNKLKSQRPENLGSMQLAMGNAKADSMSPILEGSPLFQDILEEALSRDKNIKPTYEKYEHLLPFKYTTFSLRVRKFKSEMAENFESIQLAAESASELNRESSASDAQNPTLPLEDSDRMALLERQAILGSIHDVYKRHKKDLDISTEAGFRKRVIKRKIIEYPDLIDENSFPKGLFFSQDDLNRMDPKFKPLAIKESQKAIDRVRESRKKRAKSVSA